MYHSIAVKREHTEGDTEQCEEESEAVGEEEVLRVVAVYVAGWVV